jgi:hypothetical protein
MCTKTNSTGSISTNKTLGWWLGKCKGRVRDKAEIGIVTGSVRIKHDDSESCRRDEKCTRGSLLVHYVGKYPETVSSGDIDNPYWTNEITFEDVLELEKRVLCERVETLRWM